MSVAPANPSPEQAAARAQAKILLLMDHSLDFLELVGHDGVIHGVSNAIKALAGYEPGELIGRSYRELIHPDDCEQAVDAFSRVLKEGHVGPVTMRYRRKDGSWRTIQMSARNWIEDPSANAIVVLTRDVTDQLQAESSLADANAELHRLAQQLIVSVETERGHLARELHDDVQQILVGIRLGMDAVPANESNPPALRLGWRDSIRLASEHLRALARGLHPATLDAHGVVAAITEYVEQITTAASPRFHLVLPPSLGDLGSDLQLTCFRIIQEAVANAIRHARATRIRISVSQHGSMLSIDVTDDGEGFDVSAARARALEGRSMGILSMRERASLVGGRLTVTSTAAHGTSVCATLPIGPAGGVATSSVGRGVAR